MALSKPREAALKVLYAVDNDGAYMNVALRAVLAETRMEPRDSALATEISFGVTKNKLYIDNIISHISSVKLKKLSVWIHNILRIGIYSIKFLDRVPVSATVNECVKLSRRYGHGASAGFVNAVLRKAAVCGDFLPEDKFSVQYLSIRYSFPEWIIKLWLGQGYDADMLEAMNEAAPVVVRLNTLRGETVEDGFERCPLAPHAYYYKKGGSVEETELFARGLITVQDIASQRAVNLLEIRENSEILDLCAAPGGKTAYAAQLMKNTGEITACDIHEHKLGVMAANFRRLGVTNTAVLLNNAEKKNEAFIDKFDFVISDVPCSGLGIIRRKPDIKWTKKPDEINELVKIQRTILNNAALYVKRGGRLLYSTCTVNRMENEDNVKQFLENNANFKICEGCGEYGIQMLPHKDGTDGFFAAVFERM